MLRLPCLLLLVVSVSASAQRGKPTGTPAPLPELKVDGSTANQGPDGNVAYNGVLLKPFCFTRPTFCATPGMKLSLWTQYGSLVALQAIESPQPFTFAGVRFAAKAPVELIQGTGDLVRGTLEAPVEVDGRLVKGKVELVFAQGKLLHAQGGTLAREAVIEGWKVPAGYAFDLQNLASGSVVLTGPKGAAPASWVGEALPGIPSKATAITQWRDVQGATNLQLELPTAQTIAGVVFGPGPVTFLRRGELSAVRGAVSAAFERGAVKAPRGASVVLCGEELQTVMTEDAAIRVGRYVTSKLDAVRERTPPGWRNDLYGQQVLDECGEGALLGHRFLPQYCERCKGNEPIPSLVVVDLEGEPRDAESRSMLEAFPSTKKPSCPPCR